MGEGTYTVASGGSVTAPYNGGGTYPNGCAYSAIYYGTLTSSGSDTITVTLTGAPKFGVVVVYELGAALTPPTAVNGGCGGCYPITIVTSSSLSVVANSFLVTAGTNCQGADATQPTLTGPGGFTSTYGPGSPEYVGYQLPNAAGSQNFPMTSSGSGFGTTVCWSDVGAQFVDPPPPPGWNPATSGNASPGVGLTATDVLVVELSLGSITGSMVVAFIALRYQAFKSAKTSPRNPNDLDERS